MHAGQRPIVFVIVVGAGRPWWEGMRDGPPSVVLLLYMVDKVASSRMGEGAVQLHATPPQSRTKGFMGGMMIGGSTGRELLRFNPLSTTRHGNVLGLNKDIDGMIVWLRLLMDWNWRRLVREIKEGRAVVIQGNCWPHLPGTSPCCEGKQGREERGSNRLLPTILHNLSSGK